MSLLDKYYDFHLKGKTEGVSTSEAIVFKIVSDLKGRKGIGDEFDQIDSDIQEEILQHWTAIVDTTK